MKCKLTVYYLNVLLLLFSAQCNFCVEGGEDVVSVTSFLDGGYLRSMLRSYRQRSKLAEIGQRSNFPFNQESLGNFPCNVTNMRSDKVPDSVHRLRPGDIDVVAAFGDSLTAATAASAYNVSELFIDNRGLSWSIGGQWSWHNASTLPNILKEFNPNLTGYSTRDSFGSDKESRFNVAEFGASSIDIPYQAKLFLRRIRHERNIDINQTWKMVTILIGGIDLCSLVCTMEDPGSLPRKHEQHLLKALRYLRDNLPRTIVNIVSVPSIKDLVNSADKPFICENVYLIAACSCWIGHLYNQNRESQELYNRIQLEMREVEYNVTVMNEFRHLDEFAVVYQPWTTEISFKRPFDYSLMAHDCFHFSQKGHGWAGVALWNNLLERPGNKSTKLTPPAARLLCPSEKTPYIFTNDNCFED